ncbi:MAG: hypothetical protein IPO22_16170 [Anaerolineales bacterium]|nr:hypothetical protein [Anaerolineales bacterium]
MTDTNEILSPADTLCVTCGLCCTGHLFLWAKLKSVEVQTVRGLGLNVLGVEPENRGFGLPCPLWAGKCPIHTSPDYPHACRTYKCKLLKQVIDESTPLSEALDIIEQIKDRIKELKTLLPASPNNNFRERLVAHLEHLDELSTLGDSDRQFQQKAAELLSFYRKQLGVKGLFERLEEDD